MSTTTLTPNASQPQDAPVAAPAPADAPTTTESSQPGGHRRGHNWMMPLMCLPMLILVGALVITGAVGSGAIIYALGCLAMMALMMRMMSGDHRH